MTAVRILAAVCAVLGLGLTSLSILRSVVLPRGVPARLARITFLVVDRLLMLRLRLGRRRAEYATRDRVLALLGPLGIFGQLVVWASLLLLCFTVLFWALTDVGSLAHSWVVAVELAGSAMFTLGNQASRGVWADCLGFVAAGSGLVLLALVIGLVPSLYGAFSQREAQIAKLVIRAGSPPTGVRLLCRTWQLERFDDLEEVWGNWEDWFVALGESHTTFPLLGFFRSSHPDNHWVLASEAVLDGASLMRSVVDRPRQSRSELMIEAGIEALGLIADFVGIPRPAPEDEPGIALSRATFDAGRAELIAGGVPVHPDAEAGWTSFCEARVRYETLLAQLGRLTDAPVSDWSPWSADMPRHRPPLIRIHRV